MLGPASTDAVNRAPRSGYSEVTGLTQTGRNFGASLGMAVLGTILLIQNKANVAAALIQHGVRRPMRTRPPGRCPRRAARPAPAGTHRTWSTRCSSPSRTQPRPCST